MADNVISYKKSKETLKKPKPLILQNIVNSAPELKNDQKSPKRKDH